MNDQIQKQLGKTLWNIADTLRGAMNADDFRDYMLSFLFLRYLSDNYEAAAKRELGGDYPSDSDVAAERERVSALRAEAAERAAKVRQNARSIEDIPLDGTDPRHSDIATPLQLWYRHNPDDVAEFEKQMRRKVHYVIQPPYLWNNIVDLGSGLIANR